MITLPAEVHNLLDTPEVATFATIEPTGQPHLSVVWVKRDGDEVLASTVRSTRKALNLDRDARATILVYAKDDPAHYVEIRGTVSIVDDPEGRLMNELSHQYKGEPWTRDVPGSVRVIIRLTPTKVVAH
jgi:PPOX class probable F420-dependent enzyme